jgi:hypothetical protein
MTLNARKRPRTLFADSFFRFLGAAALAMLLLLTALGRANAACPSCGASPCTISGTSTIGSGDTCDYTGKDVILTGTLNGDNNAACYTVIANNLTVRGTLRARGSCVNVNVSGDFKMEVVSNSAATVDVRDADSTGDGVFVTCGSATINGKEINADADGDQTPAYFPSGDIEITCSGNITGTGGPIHASATGGDDGGSITITSTGGTINLSGAMDVSGGGDFSFGGDIVVDGNGNVTVGASNHSLQAQSAQGGFAGSVEIDSGGTATVNGAINVNGNGEDTDGGSITVDAAAVSTGTSWNARGDSGGDGGSIDVSALSGAGTVTTTSGSNQWNVSGASFPDDGGWGGTISVFALSTITLNGDMDAGGHGDSASGGDIDIETDGNITQESTSNISADSTGTDASDGTTTLVGCSMTVKGVVDTRNLTDGTNAFDYAGTFTQNSGSNILASASNDFFCRCVDTSPADGVCDTPATCASPPTLNGTVNPAATLIPVIRATCS